MPIDFSNNGYISKNGTKSLHNSEHVIYSTTKRSGFSNPKASPKGMEAKLFLTVLSWVGVGSYIGAIILNVGTWKADILWGLAVMFGIVKFIGYSIKVWQDFRKGEIEIKMQQKNIK